MRLVVGAPRAVCRCPHRAVLGAGAFLKSQRLHYHPSKRLQPCSSSYPSAGEPTNVAEDIEQLQWQLQQAVQKEEYRKATEIKSRIQKLIDSDPQKRLQLQLDLAVQEERYQDASRIKSELNELKSRQAQEFLQKFATVQTSSEAETRGIHVHVQSVFVPEQSFSAFEPYVFAYKVTIKNNSSDTVRLVSRHWKITDATGHVKHVKGLGVVGQAPILTPGTSFEYNSFCPLPTPQGTMEGSYKMVILGDLDTREDEFEAKIAMFALRLDIVPDLASS